MLCFFSKRCLKGGDLLLVGGSELIDLGLVVGDEFLVGVGLDLELFGKESIFLVCVISLFLQQARLLLISYL